MSAKCEDQGLQIMECALSGQHPQTETLLGTWVKNAKDRTAACDSRLSAFSFG